MTSLWVSAFMNAMRASVGCPPRLHSNSVSMATCQWASSDSCSGYFVMKSAACFSVRSFRPSGRMIGSSNGVDQGKWAVLSNSL